MVKSIVRIIRKLKVKARFHLSFKIDFNIG